MIQHIEAGPAGIVAVTKTVQGGTDKWPDHKGNMLDKYQLFLNHTSSVQEKRLRPLSNVRRSWYCLCEYIRHHYCIICSYRYTIYSVRLKLEWGPPCYIIHDSTVLRKTKNNGNKNIKLSKAFLRRQGKMLRAHFWRHTRPVTCATNRVSVVRNKTCCTTEMFPNSGSAGGTQVPEEQALGNNRT